MGKYTIEASERAKKEMRQVEKSGRKTDLKRIER